MRSLSVVAARAAHLYGVNLFMTINRREFKERGYTVIKNLLSEVETRGYIKYLEELSGSSQVSPPSDCFKWNMQYGVSKNPSFWPLIFNPELLDAIRGLLNSSSIRYIEQSDLKVWKRQSSTGWHRDSITEHYGLGSEWDEHVGEYKVVRVAFYFQPREDKFFWGAIPGSHLNEIRLTGWEKRLWRLLLRQPTPRMVSRLPYLEASDGRLWIRTKPTYFPTAPPTSPIWIRTTPGDCIIFDPRLIHAGGPVPHHKFAAFLSFGVPNDHSLKHLSKFSESQGIETTEGLRDDLLFRLRKADLLLT